MERDTYSEEYRLECLARYVAKLPTRQIRVEWLQKYEEIHGVQEANRLRDLVRAEYAKLWRDESTDPR